MGVHSRLGEFIDRVTSAAGADDLSETLRDISVKIGFQYFALSHHLDVRRAGGRAINVSQAISVHPGAPAQLPHRDQDMWRGPVGEIEYLVNVIWPLTSFTPTNGATRVWPRSHGAAALRADPPCDPVDAVMAPGSALARKSTLPSSTSWFIREKDQAYGRLRSGVTHAPASSSIACSWTAGD